MEAADADNRTDRIGDGKGDVPQLSCRFLRPGWCPCAPGTGRACLETPLTDCVVILNDHDALAGSAAALFAEQGSQSVDERGCFRVAVSGGSTPLRLFSYLAEQFAGARFWNRTHLFWVDERCVPPDHDESNFGNAYKRLISRVSIPAENVHRMRGENIPENEADRYEGELREVFGRSGIPVFDLIILGMGEDGHTASLFPGSAALKEESRLVVAVFDEKRGSWRITLTLPVLNNGRLILFLVAGRAKSDMLSRVLGKKEETLLPAAMIIPVRGDLRWLVTRDAAEGIPQGL